MICDKTQSVESFVSAAAAKQPAPGGGSVTALVGALAASMGEMVVNYSVGKKDLAAQDTTFREALAELSRARSLMLELLAEDQGAFAALTAARKACNNAGDRDPAFAAALLLCIRIPQSIGATAMAVLELSARLAPIANKYLLSDLAVSAELAMATVRCAAYNVRVNLADVSDQAERNRIDALSDQEVRRGANLIQSVIPTIWRRLGRPA